jgi:hypothetical protein
MVGICLMQQTKQAGAACFFHIPDGLYIYLMKNGQTGDNLWPVNMSGFGKSEKDGSNNGVR